MNVHDQAARDAALDLDTTVFVEAAAGTGKTTTLIARILAAVTSRRARVHEIVAITFTEKAAGELKMRLRAQLEKQMPAALPDLERAHITTIHSFCAWVLRERPVEAAVDPQFQVADALRSRLLLDEAWEEWFTGQLSANSPALRAAILHEMSVSQLRELAEMLVTHRDQLGNWPDRLPLDLPAIVAQLQGGAPTLQSALKHHIGAQPNPVQQAQALLDVLAAAGHLSPERLTAALSEIKLVTIRAKADFDSPAVWKDFNDTVKELRAALEEFTIAADHNLLLDLAGWLHGFVAHFQQSKHDAALLDFDDLLLKTRDLLRDNAEVRRTLQERFRFILVDEFQDTDPVQTEIVLLLDEGTPGKLFIVGDPKQSIYRFRGADIELYAATRKKLTQRGTVLQFQQNFRSAATILDWVNATFRKLILEPTDGHYQPAYIELIAAPQHATTQPTVTLLRPSAFAKLNALQTRRTEAAAIARYLRARGGKWSDVVLLFRSFSGVDIYADVFAEHGIPVRVIGGRGYYQRQEIQTLLSLLSCLDNPGDQLHLIATLRSPLFGWTDERVFTTAAAGRLDYLHNDALALLRELHDQRHTRSVAGYVEWVMARTKICETFLATQPDGGQCVANLLKALELARQLEATGLRSVRQFVRQLRETVVAGLDEEPSPANEESDNVVRFLTMHKSKGLEFPVVVLPDLAGRSNDSGATLLFGATVELRFGGCRTAKFDESNEHQKKREEAEEIRLLYVAATRAKERLVVPWFAEKGERLDLLRRGFEPVASALVDVVEADALPAAPATPLPKSNPPGDPLADRQRWQTELRDLIARGAQPVTRTSPSQLAHDTETPARADDVFEVRERRIEIGIAVHEALERGEAGTDPEVQELVRRARESDLWQRMERAETIYRELPFALPEMDGKMDVLFREQGRWVLVDYKTDAQPDPAKYSAQMNAYAAALQQIAGLTVAEKLLFFLRTGTVVRVTND